MFCAKDYTVEQVRTVGKTQRAAGRFSASMPTIHSFTVWFQMRSVYYVNPSSELVLHQRPGTEPRATTGTKKKSKKRTLSLRKPIVRSSSASTPLAMLRSPRLSPSSSTWLLLLICRRAARARVYAQVQRMRGVVCSSVWLPCPFRNGASNTSAGELNQGLVGRVTQKCFLLV